MDLREQKTYWNNLKIVLQSQIHIGQCLGLHSLKDKVKLQYCTNYYNIKK